MPGCDHFDIAVVAASPWSQIVAPAGTGLGLVRLSGSETTAEFEALQVRLQRLETAVEATGLGIWEWDVATGQLTWNANNRQLFGVTHERPLTIDDFNELIHPDDREVVRQAYAEAAEKPDGGTFTMEYRTAITPGGKARWLQARARVIRGAAGVSMVVGANLDVTDRKVAEERRSLILRELAHRAKNGILVMMTIVAQTARSATSVKHFEEVLTARLRSMADSQDLVTQLAGKPLPLNDLLDQTLQTFGPDRFDRDPRLAEVNIPADMVVAMALLLHELSTNALKYGALSAAAGRVKLVLHAADEGRACLGWTEVDGPPVHVSDRRGFGTRLLDISLRNNGGHVDAEFHPDGFRAKIHFPTRRPPRV
jgi:PAS domain S-box-containing protein